MIRVIVADDHRLVRQGICQLLASDKQIQIVGEAEDGQQALELVKKLRPDVLVLDLSMPVMDGIEVLDALRKMRDGPQVVMVSMHDSSEMIQRAMSGGAAAFVAKRGSFELLVKTVKSVVQAKQ